MKHISLFSGIGGFDLAAEWMGWENVAHVEWNSFGQYNLKNYWQNAHTHTDITTTDFTVYRGIIDIITGGFPCQPYSSAGKRKGKEDNRHLWPEMLRAIREIQPTWIVGENVRGLTNWNGGLVFDEVQVDLENEGYEVTPFLLPACAVNAPHRRDRIWFVAYSNGSVTRNNNGEDNGKKRNLRRREKGDVSGELLSNGIIANTESLGGGERIGKNVDDIRKWKDREYISKGSEIWQRYQATSGTGISSNSDGFGFRGESDRIGEPGFIDETSPRDYWRNFPTQSPVCNGDDGFPTESLRQFFREDSNGLLSEEDIDKILREAYGSWRKETIKAGGNAIVPQVAYQIFKAIEQYKLLNTTL